MAIEKFPKKAILYSNRALTYLKLEKPELALEDAEEGLELNPGYVKLLYRKGKALLMLKRYEEAVQFLEGAARQFKEASQNKEFMIVVNDAKRMLEESKKGNSDSRGAK